MRHEIISMLISADWHLGAIDSERFRNELISIVQEKLKSLKSLDLFIVAGDTFDMKEYLSSDTVKSFFRILVDLLGITKKFNTEFRFIEGTRTHDAMQLETLEIICNQFVDHERIKFIHEVSREEFKGINILYLPEEYVVDSDTYYKSYLSDHYDFIFGHGPTDLMWYMKKENEMAKLHSSATVFKADELCKVANYSYFGHFHYNIAAGIDRRFKSIGPVTRWEFDKDGNCGMYYTEYDKDTGIAFEEYLLNKYAPIMPTVTFSIKKNYELDDLNRLLHDRLDKVKDTADKTRLIVVIDSTLEQFVVMRDFVLASFGKIPDVKLLLKIVSSSETDDISDVETTEENSLEERPYLYDKSMRDEARIASFIKKKAGANISLENILSIIKPKDTKIGNREE